MYALKTVKGWYELTTVKLVKIEITISVRQTFKDRITAVPWRKQLSFYACLFF